MAALRSPAELRIVADTNVLISALGFHGETRRIWTLAEERRFRLFVSPFILRELETNLRAKLKLPADAVALLIEEVRLLGTVVEPHGSVAVIRGKESDNRILECAVEAEADVIVTGNMKHIRPLGSFQGIGILTPREFLDRYFPSSGQ
jgi:putative PIN family toxin of toxin-antitoxin system